MKGIVGLFCKIGIKSVCKSQVCFPVFGFGLCRICEIELVCVMFGYVVGNECYFHVV